MIILAIDPGDVESGFCFYNTEKHKIPQNAIIQRGKVSNVALKGFLRNNASKIAVVYIEDIAYYGMGVGKTIFETLKYIGRLQEICESLNIRYVMKFRKSIVTHHTENPRTNDTVMKQWFENTIGAIGKKKYPGPYYGITSDEISAIALAMFGADLENVNAKTGKTS